MFLFRPSNNNQRYAFVPLLDHSDKEDFADDDDENNGTTPLSPLDLDRFSRLETAIFDSVTIRKNSSMEMNANGKAKKATPNSSNRENNSTNGNVDETLDWIETNIPTSLADQAMKAFDSEEEMVNTRLERSKMQ